MVDFVFVQCVNKEDSPKVEVEVSLREPDFELERCSTNINLDSWEVTKKGGGSFIFSPDAEVDPDGIMKEMWLHEFQEGEIYSFEKEEFFDRVGKHVATFPCSVCENHVENPIIGPNENRYCSDRCFNVKNV